MNNLNDQLDKFIDELTQKDIEELFDYLMINQATLDQNRINVMKLLHLIFISFIYLSVNIFGTHNEIIS